MITETKIFSLKSYLYNNSWLTPLCYNEALSNVYSLEKGQFRCIAVFSALFIASTSNAFSTTYTAPIVGQSPPVFLQGGDIVDVNNIAPALYANGLLTGQPRSIVVQDGGISAINLGLSKRAAIESDNGGFIDLGTGSVINAAGYYAGVDFFSAAGLYAKSSGGADFPSTIIARDITINASSANIVYGAMAHNGGHINLLGDTVITVTGGGDGVGGLAGLNGDITAENLKIRIGGYEGQSGYWVQAVGSQQSGSITIAGHSDFQISGLSGALVRTVGASTSVYLNTLVGVIDSTNGMSRGLIAEGGRIDVNGTAHLTVRSEATAVGLYTTNGGSVSILAPSTITVSASDAWGIALYGGSSITVNSSTIITTGGMPGTSSYSLNNPRDFPDITPINNGSGVNVYIQSDVGGPSSKLSVNDSLLAASSDGIHAVGGTSEVNFTNTTMTNKSGTALRVSGATTTLLLSLDESNITGNAIKGEGATSNITMQHGSTWTMTGNSEVTVLRNDASSLLFSAPVGEGTLASDYKTLKLSQYAGTGGMISINTRLGDDMSFTDMIHVSGDTEGTTKLHVTNIGGIGAQTVEGIRVITVDGNSTGQFSLGGDYIHQDEQAVVGGAYAYKLYQNGITDSADGDWYLRSQLMEDEPNEPLYQGGVPTYEAYPQALLGLNGLNTLQQRVGNRFWAGDSNRVIAQGADAIQPYAAPEEAGMHVDGNGVWGRIEGAHNKIASRFSTSRTDFNQNVFKMQAGIDGLLNEAENGTLIGGVFVQYAHGKTKTRSIHGDGEISIDGYGFGGTLTWYGNDGFYVDGQGQATWYRSDMSSNLANTGLISGNNGFGHAFSAETGKRFAINPEWSVTPQAQLVYSKVDFDSFSDVWGTSVSLDKGASLQGRLGLTLDQEQSWQNANGLMNRSHIYGIANLYYEFLDGTRVEVAGTSFASKKDRVWGGAGLGGSYSWNDDKYSIYGEAIINTSLNKFGDSYTIQGNLGFRMKW